MDVPVGFCNIIWIQYSVSGPFLKNRWHCAANKRRVDRAVYDYMGDMDIFGK
jgi:hypothetical protein